MKFGIKALGVAAAVLALAFALGFGLYLALRNGSLQPSSRAPRNQRAKEDFTAASDGTVRYPGAIQGVDVSSHQGTIDWEAVKEAGFDFAILRLGYRGYTAGSVMPDETFEQNYEGAVRAGLDVGVYFYSQATGEAEAREEADFVLETLSGRALQMPVFYDWEEVSQGRTGGKATGSVSGWAKAFCRRIEEGGYKGGVYFNQAYGNTIMGISDLTEYSFWLAEYNDHQSFSCAVQFWQYTCDGHIPGISTRVDLDLMYPEGEE